MFMSKLSSFSGILLSNEGGSEVCRISVVLRSRIVAVSSAISTQVL